MTTPEWRKSSRSSQGTSGECVELMAQSDVVMVRDSKDPDGPKLLVSRETFRSFAATLKK
jgi:hypothetical protein